MNFETKELALGDRITAIRFIARFEKKANFYESVKCLSENIGNVKFELQAKAIEWRLKKFIKHRVIQFGANPEHKAYSFVSPLQIKQADNLQIVFGQHYTARGLARVIVLNEDKLRSILPGAASKFYQSSSTDINNIISWAYENR